MFLTFRYETDNKQILKLCPITVGFQLTQIFKWKVTLTSVMNMEKFCCLCNRSFNSGNIHRRSINSFSWYWLKYRNIEGKYWNLHAIILSNIIIGNTLLLRLKSYLSKSVVGKEDAKMVIWGATHDIHLNPKNCLLLNLRASTSLPIQMLKSLRQ